MSIPPEFMQTQSHRDLVDDLLALSSSEDRLSWLMERAPSHAPLLEAERIPERKVPGCLSGLWLKAEVRESVCYFSAYSESGLVHGVVSYLCDLYSGRSCAEVLAVDDLLARSLRLDGLLSMTRKRAVSAALSFFRHSARDHAGIERAA